MGGFDPKVKSGGGQPTQQSVQPDDLGFLEETSEGQTIPDQFDKQVPQHLPPDRFSEEGVQLVHGGTPSITSTLWTYSGSSYIWERFNKLPVFVRQSNLGRYVEDEIRLFSITGNDLIFEQAQKDVQSLENYADYEENIRQAAQRDILKHFPSYLPADQINFEFGINHPYGLYNYEQLNSQTICQVFKNLPVEQKKSLWLILSALRSSGYEDDNILENPLLGLGSEKITAETLRKLDDWVSQRRTAFQQAGLAAFLAKVDGKEKTDQLADILTNDASKERVRVTIAAQTLKELDEIANQGSELTPEQKVYFLMAVLIEQKERLEKMPESVTLADRLTKPGEELMLHSLPIGDRVVTPPPLMGEDKGGGKVADFVHPPLNPLPLREGKNDFSLSLANAAIEELKNGGDINRVIKAAKWLVKREVLDNLESLSISAGSARVGGKLLDPLSEVKNLSSIEDVETILDHIDQASLAGSIDESISGAEEQLVQVDSLVGPGDVGRKWYKEQLSSLINDYKKARFLLDGGNVQAARDQFLKIFNSPFVQTVNNEFAKSLDESNRTKFLAGVGIVIASGFLATVSANAAVGWLTSVFNLTTSQVSRISLLINSAGFMGSSKVLHYSLLNEMPWDPKAGFWKNAGSWGVEYLEMVGMFWFLGKGSKNYAEFMENALFRRAESQLVRKGLIEEGKIFSNQASHALVMNRMELGVIGMALNGGGAFVNEYVYFTAWDFIKATAQYLSGDPNADPIAVLSPEAMEERARFLICLKIGGTLASPITKPLQEKTQRNMLGKSYKGEIEELNKGVSSALDKLSKYKNSGEYNIGKIKDLEYELEALLRKRYALQKELAHAGATATDQLALTNAALRDASQFDAQLGILKGLAKIVTPKKPGLWEYRPEYGDDVKGIIAALSKQAGVEVTEKDGEYRIKLSGHEELTLSKSQLVKPDPKHKSQLVKPDPENRKVVESAIPVFEIDDNDIYQVEKTVVSVIVSTKLALETRKTRSVSADDMLAAIKTGLKETLSVLYAKYSGSGISEADFLDRVVAKLKEIGKEVGGQLKLWIAMYDMYDGEERAWIVASIIEEMKQQSADGALKVEVKAIPPPKNPAPAKPADKSELVKPDPETNDGIDPNDPNNSGNPTLPPAGMFSTMYGFGKIWDAGEQFIKGAKGVWKGIGPYFNNGGGGVEKAGVKKSALTPAQEKQILEGLTTKYSNTADKIRKHLPTAIKALEETDWTYKQKYDLLKTLAEKAGAVGRAYRNLPSAIRGLNATDWTSLQKYDLLKAIAEKGGEDVGWAYRNLPSAIEGLNATDWSSLQKYDLIKTLAEKEGRNVGWAYRNLPSAIRGLNATDWTSLQKYDLLKALAEKGGGYVFLAYENLPSAIEGLNATDWSSLQKYDLIKTLAEKEGEDVGWAYKYLPSAIEGLNATDWTSLQKYDLLKALAEKADRNVGWVYRNLPSAIRGLNATDWTSLQKYDLLKAIAEKARGDFAGATTFITSIVLKNSTDHDYSAKIALRLLDRLTDYNRERVLKELNEHGELFEGLGKEHFIYHLELYLEAFERWPRLGFNILEGLLEALESGVVTEDVYLRKDDIFKFMERTKGFIPALYSAYQKEGAAVFNYLESYKAKILADSFSMEDKDKIIEDYGEEFLLAVIQMASPTSGASFVKRGEQLGLMKKMLEAGDLRGHIPKKWRNKVENFLLEHGEYILKDGEKADPDRKIKVLLDSFRSGEGDKKIEKEELIKAAKDYLASDRGEAAREGLRNLLYKYAGQNDALKEKIDRIQDSDYTALMLLEQLFRDKDNLQKTFVDVLDEVPDDYFKGKGEKRPVEGDGLNLAKSVKKAWERIPEEDKRIAAIGRMLSQYEPNDIKDKLLTKDNIKGDAGLVSAIKSATSAGARVGKARIAEEIFAGPIALVQTEKVKYEYHAKEPISIGIRAVKGPAYGLNGLNSGVCTAKDVKLWKNHNFKLFAIVNEADNQVVGYVHVFEITIGGKKYLTLPGINPSVEFLGFVNAGELYNKLMEGVIKFAEDGGYDGVYIPTSSRIHSNRGDIQKAIAKAKYKTKPLEKEVEWNNLPEPYPFKEVYVVWERAKPKKTSLDKNGGIEPNDPNIELLHSFGDFLPKAFKDAGGRIVQGIRNLFGDVKDNKPTPSTIEDKGEVLDAARRIAQSDAQYEILKDLAGWVSLKELSLWEYRPENVKEIEKAASKLSKQGAGVIKKDGYYHIVLGEREGVILTIRPYQVEKTPEKTYQIDRGLKETNDAAERTPVINLEENVRTRILDKETKGNDTPVKILVIGAGEGNAEAELIRELGADADKVEITAFSKEYEIRPENESAIKNSYVKDMDRDSIPGKYDLIVSIYGSSHAKDQIGAVQKVFNALNPDGEALFILQEKSLGGKGDKELSILWEALNIGRLQEFFVSRGIEIAGDTAFNSDSYNPQAVMYLRRDATTGDISDLRSLIKAADQTSKINYRTYRTTKSSPPQKIESYEGLLREIGKKLDEICGQMNLIVKEDHYREWLIKTIADDIIDHRIPLDAAAKNFIEKQLAKNTAKFGKIRTEAQVVPQTTPADILERTKMGKVEKFDHAIKVKSNSTSEDVYGENYIKVGDDITSVTEATIDGKKYYIGTIHRKSPELEIMFLTPDDPRGGDINCLSLISYEMIEGETRSIEKGGVAKSAREKGLYKLIKHAAWVHAGRPRFISMTNIIPTNPLYEKLEKLMKEDPHWPDLTHVDELRTHYEEITGRKVKKIEITNPDVLEDNKIGFRHYAFDLKVEFEVEKSKTDPNDSGPGGVGTDGFKVTKRGLDEGGARFDPGTEQGKLHWATKEIGNRLELKRGGGGGSSGRTGRRNGVVKHPEVKQLTDEQNIKLKGWRELAGGNEDILKQIDSVQLKWQLGEEVPQGLIEKIEGRLTPISTLPKPPSPAPCNERIHALLDVIHDQGLNKFGYIKKELDGVRIEIENKLITKYRAGWSAIVEYNDWITISSKTAKKLAENVDVKLLKELSDEDCQIIANHLFWDLTALRIFGWGSKQVIRQSVFNNTTEGIFNLLGKYPRFIIQRSLFGNAQKMAPLYMDRYNEALKEAENQLKGVEDAGEIAKTLAKGAFTAKDPKGRVKVLIERWNVAYNEAKEQLKGIEDAGEIARRIAIEASSAEDPKGRVKVLIERWRVAYNEAKEQLKGIEDAGEIARTLAIGAFAAKDPKGRVKVLIERWNIGYNEAKEQLKGVEGAGEIARTLAIGAFAAKDPKGRVKVLIERWNVAYNEAKEQLKSVEDAGEIARSIAIAAFRAKNPKGQVKVLIERWNIGYNEAKEQLKNIEDAGEIARRIADVASSAEDPKGRVKVLIERWRVAYNEAKEQLKDVKDAGEIAKTIAIVAFQAEEPKGQVKVLIERWNVAYNEAKEQLKGVKDAGGIARRIAIAASSAEDPKGRVKVLIERWRVAYNEAKEQLKNIEDAGEIAKTIAKEAFVAKDPKGQVKVLIERWGVAYNEAKEQLKSVEDAGEIARSIAIAAFRAKNPKGRVKVLIERWRVAYNEAKEQLKNIEDAGEIARSIADVAFRLEDPKGQVAILIKRYLASKNNGVDPNDPNIELLHSFGDFLPGVIKDAGGRIFQGIRNLFGGSASYAPHFNSIKKIDDVLRRAPLIKTKFDTLWKLDAERLNGFLLEAAKKADADVKTEKGALTFWDNEVKARGYDGLETYIMLRFGYMASTLLPEGMRAHQVKTADRFVNFRENKAGYISKRWPEIMNELKGEGVPHEERPLLADQIVEIEFLYPEWKGHLRAEDFTEVDGHYKFMPREGRIATLEKLISRAIEDAFPELKIGPDMPGKEVVRKLKPFLTAYRAAERLIDDGGRGDTHCSTSARRVVHLLRAKGIEAHWLWIFRRKSPHGKENDVRYWGVIKKLAGRTNLRATSLGNVVRCLKEKISYQEILDLARYSGLTVDEMKNVHQAYLSLSEAEKEMLKQEGGSGHGVAVAKIGGRWWLIDINQQQFGKDYDKLVFMPAEDAASAGIFFETEPDQLAGKGDFFTPENPFTPYLYDADQKVIREYMKIQGSLNLRTTEKKKDKDDPGDMGPVLPLMVLFGVKGIWDKFAKWSGKLQSTNLTATEQAEVEEAIAKAGPDELVEIVKRFENINGHDAAKQAETMGLLLKGDAPPDKLNTMNITSTLGIRNRVKAIMKERIEMAGEMLGGSGFGDDAREIYFDKDGKLDEAANLACDYNRAVEKLKGFMDEYRLDWKNLGDVYDLLKKFEQAGEKGNWNTFKAFGYLKMVGNISPELRRDLIVETINLPDIHNLHLGKSDLFRVLIKLLKFESIQSPLIELDEVLKAGDTYDSNGDFAFYYETPEFRAEVKEAMDELRRWVKEKRLPPTILDDAKVLLNERGFDEDGNAIKSAPSGVEQAEQKVVEEGTLKIEDYKEPGDKGVMYGASIGKAGVAVNIDKAMNYKVPKAVLRHLSPMFSNGSLKSAIESMERMADHLAEQEGAEEPSKVTLETGRFLKDSITKDIGTGEIYKKDYIGRDEDATMIIEESDKRWRSGLLKQFVEEDVPFDGIGEGWFWRMGEVGHGEKVGRFYVSLNHNYAGDFWCELGRVALEMEREGIPLKYKMSVFLERMQAGDPAVIYFRAEDQMNVYKKIVRLVTSHPEWFKSNKPAFTARVFDEYGQPVKGLAFAQNPSQRGTSFGWEFSHIIKDAILLFRQLEKEGYTVGKQELESLVAYFLAKSGKDVEHPAFEKGGLGIFKDLGQRLGHY